jgi:hypothetical protein
MRRKDLLPSQREARYEPIYGIKDSGVLVALLASIILVYISNGLLLFGQIFT